MEPTASELQAQIDRLSLTVQQGRDASVSLDPVARQLAQLSERCNEILQRWAETDTRTALAVNDVGARLDSLQTLHEEPVRQLRDQAAALGEVCVSAANLALQGFERAEARLNAIETGLQDRLNQLSRDLQTAIAEGRAGAQPPALAAPVSPFPIESVMRIHDDLRKGADAGPAIEPARAGDPDAMALILRDAASQAGRIERPWHLAIAGLGVLVVVATVIFVVMQRQVNARLDAAATRVAAAEQQATAASTAATQQIAASRADADRQITEARQTAAKAEIVTNVLAAPDLVRIALIGTERAPRASAQVLFSRTRGLVLSASALPALTDGATYHMWLLSDGAPAAAGKVVPDAAGRATFVVDALSNLPRAVTGVSVTVETADVPSTPGAAVLVRVPPQGQEP